MSRFTFDNGVKRDFGEENVTVLVEAMRKADSNEKMENLLKGLLTPKEIEEFAERIRIVQLLKKGVSQHDIAGKLGVGVATVSRGARELKLGNFQTV